MNIVIYFSSLIIIKLLLDLISFLILSISKFIELTPIKFPFIIFSFHPES